MGVGNLVGRVGEFLAYFYLSRRGKVTFDDKWDFRFNGRPVEVKTRTEHNQLPYYYYSEPCKIVRSTRFSLKRVSHNQLCEQDGLYCFVLLRDDGYASIKMVDAKEIQPCGRTGERQFVSWGAIFRYRRVGKLRVCDEPRVAQWEPLVCPEALSMLNSRRRLK